MLKLLGTVGLVTLIHSWYPWQCCSDKDCRPVPVRDVIVRDGFYILPNGRKVSTDDALDSPDDNFHVCENKDGVVSAKQGLCFWAPRGGM